MQVVEANLRAGGFKWAWTEQGLRKWNVMSPFKVHPRTGEKVRCGTTFYLSTLPPAPLYPPPPSLSLSALVTGVLVILSQLLNTVRSSHLTPCRDLS